MSQNCPTLISAIELAESSTILDHIETILTKEFAAKGSNFYQKLGSAILNYNTAMSALNYTFSVDLESDIKQIASNAAMDQSKQGATLLIYKE